MTRLAVLHRDGLGCRADPSEAAVWFRRAAELGNSEAQADLAQLYAEGRGLERSPDEALHWAGKASVTNSEAAALHGQLVEGLPPEAQADAWHRLALEMLAQEEAGRDETRLTEALRRAAELGDAIAMRQLALRYLDGSGVERDWTAGAEWLHRAAEAGNMEGALAYAGMVFAGDGVPADPPAALPWARRAAEAGIAEAPGLVAAIERAIAAATAEPPMQSPAAELADSHDEAPETPEPSGETPARVPAEPVITAEPTDAMGQTALGLDYYFGRNGRPRDLTAAAKWLLRGANNGSLAAQHNISVMYAHGQGLRVDPTEGARWCRIAAERGDQRSQYRMSYLCSHGQGVNHDQREALFWAELAARQGHHGALAARDGLAAKMTAEQIAEVRQRANAFQPRA